MALVTKNFSDIITFSRASGATWFNSAGILQGVDFSVTSNTIGTGSKTFTLDATAGVNRYWAAGDTVLISDQANSANNMVGTVTSYNASTQVLVCDITSTGGSGTLTAWRIGSTMPRFDYDPSTLAAQGLLIEEARTNSIRNNTMQGAVAGTPGTLPTNWATVGVGLAFNVVGLGTEAGLPYIDIQVVGTTGSTSAGIRFDTNTGIAAVAGQAWTSSAYARMVAGSTTNISAVSINCSFLDAVAGIINSTSVSFTSTISQPSLPLARRTAENVVAGVGTLYARSQIIIAYASGVAIDITLRIGLPQLELGAFATSVIPTTNALPLGVTRSADVAAVNTLSPWFNATEGTIVANAVMNGSLASGAVGQNTVFRIDDTTDNERIFVRSNTGEAQFVGIDGGATQWDLRAGNTLTLGVAFKHAAAYKINDIASAFNGSNLLTYTTATLPTATRMLLGNGSGGNYLNGYLRRITYYPRRLSNVELQSITTP